MQQSVIYSLDDGVPIFKSYSNKKDKEFILEDSKLKQIIPAREEAKEFILDTLDEQKQMEISELDELALTEGFTKHSIKDAKAELRKENKIHIWSIGYGKDKKFLISLKDTLKTA